MEKSLSQTVYFKSGFSQFKEMLKEGAVIFGVSNKLWIFISSALSAPLILIFLSPAYQGFYYTFNSLLGLQTIFVMGFGQLIQQFVSHEWAEVKYISGSGISGNLNSIKRLGTIKQISLRWFSLISFICLIGLLAGGYFFLKDSADTSAIPLSNWLLPWTAICVLKSIQILISPGLTFLEGMNYVESVNKFRLSQSVSERIAAWLILIIGGKLWLFAAGTGINVIGQINFYKRRFFDLLKNIFRLKGKADNLWKNEILPLQWRYAISSLSGYLNFSFIIPLVFWYLGPVKAGQTGITWAIITMFWGLSVTLISVKVPEIAIQAARKNYQTAENIFNSTKINSIVLLICLVILFYVSLIFAEIYFPGLASRFLTPLPSLLLCLTIIPHHLKFAMVSFMRAVKKEPFWNVSIIESIILILIMPPACKYFGVIGLSVCFLIVISFSTFLAFIIFKKQKKLYLITG